MLDLVASGCLRYATSTDPTNRTTTYVETDVETTAATPTVLVHLLSPTYHWTCFTVGGINLLTSIDGSVSNQVKKYYCSSHVYLTFGPLQTRHF
jgi:hypothetical protein